MSTPKYLGLIAAALFLGGFFIEHKRDSEGVVVLGLLLGFVAFAVAFYGWLTS